MKGLGWGVGTSCPSPTVPNLLPNEHEWTIRVGSGIHSWSFPSIPIHLSSVLLMGVRSACENESFDHVQKLRVASTNQFHSCLCVLRTCSYRVCRTAYVLYSSHSHCIRTVFWLFLLYTRSFVHVGGTGANTMDQNTVRMELECARDCCKVHFLLFTFVLVRV